MEYLFQGCCVEYMDIVLRAGMVRSFRDCASALDDADTRDKLTSFQNPIHDITTFDFVVMQQATNLVTAFGVDEIQEAMRDLAAFLEAHDEFFENEFLTATGSVSAGVQLREIRVERERAAKA